MPRASAKQLTGSKCKKKMVCHTLVCHISFGHYHHPANMTLSPRPSTSCPATTPHYTARCPNCYASHHIWPFPPLPVITINVAGSHPHPTASALTATSFPSHSPIPPYLLPPYPPHPTAAASTSDDEHKTAQWKALTDKFDETCMPKT